MIEERHEWRWYSKDEMCGVKGSLKMSSTVGKKFDRIGMLLDSEPGCTSGNRRRGTREEK